MSKETLLARLAKEGPTVLAGGELWTARRLQRRGFVKLQHEAGATAPVVPAPRELATITQDGRSELKRLTPEQCPEWWSPPRGGREWLREIVKRAIALEAESRAQHATAPFRGDLDRSITCQVLAAIGRELAADLDEQIDVMKKAESWR